MAAFSAAVVNLPPKAVPKQALPCSFTEASSSASKLPVFSVSSRASRSGTSLQAKGRDFEESPFSFGPDPDLEYGDLLSKGKQDASEPGPQQDPDSEDGLLDFPAAYNLEIASLGTYIRGDVRSCVILAAGGVYENLLLFPLIQLLKDRYPGVRIDVAASARGKQTYEINKHVRRAWVYDVEDSLITPGEYTEFLGKLKNECYDLVLSTRPAGIGHAMFMFLTDARFRVAYVIPNAGGAGAGLFLSTALRAERMNLAEAGYDMYSELLSVFSAPERDIPTTPVTPLDFSLPSDVRSVVRDKCAQEGLTPGTSSFTVVHGVESTSAASMRARGDSDSQMPLGLMSEIVKGMRGDVVVVIPNDTDRLRVEEVLGSSSSAKIIKITTPGQLAALIDDASALVATNTAALQFAAVLKKPSVALFGSQFAAAKFLPSAQEKNCTIVASPTGSLEGLTADSILTALAKLPSASSPSLVAV